MIVKIGSVEIPLDAFNNWKFIGVAILVIVLIPVCIWIKGKWTK